MDKSEVIALGVSEEIATSLIEKFMGELNGKYVPKTRLDEVIEAKKHLDEQIKTYEGQVEELKKVKPEELQEQIVKLQSANATMKNDYEKSINQMRVDAVVERELTKAGSRNNIAVRALLTDVLGKAVVKEDGIEGLAEKIISLKQNESSTFLFKPDKVPAPTLDKDFNPPPSEGETSKYPVGSYDWMREQLR